MPGQTADSRHSLELVDDSSGNEVDVIVVQLDSGVSDPFPPQLVQFSVVDPLNALRTGAGERDIQKPNMTKINKGEEQQ